MGASIKDMYHERAFLHSNIDHVKVKVIINSNTVINIHLLKNPTKLWISCFFQCVVELQGKEHAQKLKKALVESGYDPVWDDESEKNMI